MWKNLERHRRLFPEIPTHLIISDDRHRSRVTKGISVLKYERDSRTHQLFRGLDLEPSFRDGFWHLTLERLLALEVLHRLFPEDSLLHVESDVLLMPSFPWDVLALEKTMLWGEADANEDVAALLFTPDLKHTRHLAKFLREEMNKNRGTSDMRALRAYYELERGKRVSRLPTGPESKPMAGGIFDVLAIGMWLGGMDPSNARGIRTYGISMPHHSVIASTMTYEFDGVRLFADASVSRVEVFSLHIHSKDLKVFSSNWQRQLKYFIRLSKSVKRPIRRFSVMGFARWLRELIRELTSKQFRLAVKRRLFG